MAEIRTNAFTEEQLQSRLAANSPLSAENEQPEDDEISDDDPDDGEEAA